MPINKTVLANSIMRSPHSYHVKNVGKVLGMFRVQMITMGISPWLHNRPSESLVLWCLCSITISLACSPGCSMHVDHVNNSPSALFESLMARFGSLIKHFILYRNVLQQGTFHVQQIINLWQGIAWCRVIVWCSHLAQGSQYHISTLSPHVSLLAKISHSNRLLIAKDREDSTL